MKKAIAWSLILGAAISGMAIAQRPQDAHASSTLVKIVSLDSTAYYTKSKRSAYVWNKNHTRKMHNLKNYPKTTWYATGKYSMKSTTHRGVYLQISNGSGKAKGYVWSGYMKKGVNPAYPQGTIVGPTGVAMSTYNVDNKLNRQLLSLFPGSIPDKTLQKFANLGYIYHNIGDGFYNYGHLMIGDEIDSEVGLSSQTLIADKGINFKTFEKIQIAKILEFRGKTFSDFKDYRIGAYAFPAHSKYYGELSIIMLPPK
ncbi:D-alanyl-D-alanine carboxypeptidase [Levilactobacillus cerevisiae]|uniref:D-alanyl-D-alanine carboxypeptidase n=1 Tax=Levilactobacillus cerevisiae TaxID=1704076 RepID=UPI000F7776FC|nr:D-alanyl-D-alanine carboxypeptidase [Levilactobacillus cerevisiae]